MIFNPSFGPSFELLPKALLISVILLAAGCTRSLNPGSSLLSGPKTAVTVDYYTVNASTASELDAEIRKNGPKGATKADALAVARITMIPTVSFVTRNNQCRVSAANIRVDAKVVLPKWVERKQASARLGRAWDNLDRYARYHEGQHIQIATRYARKLEKSLLKLPPAQNCEIAKQIAQSLIDVGLKNHDQQQLKFDREEQTRVTGLLAGKV